ncbi:C40 family peptidase [Chitinasiproducens palmae]|uniref:Cell wall-associated hydrolase, NlpC family n=1 Tax=Chitinasiproducens palmae TaxID=1770053 RepID=A0A1H2PM05_9BURK|nr:C40 family peptidase [Chitinasiproducens palmae]SDV47544.1 Cell wall-associated hydrolase, NlpC family [Chitinasiproducens palmae]
MLSPSFFAPSMRLPALLLVVTASALVVGCGSTPPARESASGAKGGLRTAHGGAPKAYAPPSGFPRFVDQSVGTEEISIQAMSLVGVPYRWGGNTPEAGFDCSGLVRYVVARAADVELPRTTADMSQRGSPIDPDGVAPGDLIYFNTTGRPHSHVGIYVGNYRFVNAPSTGGTVRIDYVTNPYWAKRFDGLRRIDRATRSPFDAPQWQAAAPAAATVATAPAPVRPVATPVRPPAAVAPAVAAVAVSSPAPRVDIAGGREDGGSRQGGSDPIAGAIASAEAGAALDGGGGAAAPMRVATAAPRAPSAYAPRNAYAPGNVSGNVSGSVYIAPENPARAAAPATVVRTAATRPATVAGQPTSQLTVQPTAQPTVQPTAQPVPQAIRTVPAAVAESSNAPSARPAAPDAFEPPPPLARQAMRQVPNSPTLDARTHGDDDPIGRMAAGQL